MEENFTGFDDQPCENVFENLKEDINNFLYMRLHGKTSLDDMEKIAVNLYKEIRDNWRNKEISESG